ncbi:MAG: hypothetical protein SGJ18_13095 [Pseudomonadota bacterium]|nr:hypothetical protein [Pseudomonadota bacterium]
MSFRNLFLGLFLVTTQAATAQHAPGANIHEKNVICSVGAVTKGHNIMGDFHQQDTVTLQFDSSETVEYPVVGGGTEKISFGSGVAQITRTVRMWDNEKKEILKPLIVKVEISRLGANQKVGKFSVIMFNPFTAQLVTTERDMSPRHATNGFIYDHEILSSPTIDKAQVGDLIQSYVFCNFESGT